jgi:8-oxo-dGTP pyrophosphatase MutT (NUDIX family)
MTGSSLLPVAVYKGKLFFLFGKENPLEDSAKGFSDFGGGVDEGENIYEAALREGSEELTGFLGSPEQLKKYIKKHGGTYRITYNSDRGQYHVHLFFIHYDEDLPHYYNNNHAFLWKRMDQKYLNKTKLFEKIVIEWFCEDDLQKRTREYRGFYANVVKMIVEDLENVREFIGKCSLKCFKKGDGKCHVPVKTFTSRHKYKGTGRGATRKMKGGGDEDQMGGR